MKAAAHERCRRRAVEIAHSSPGAPFGSVTVDEETSKPTLSGETAGVMDLARSRPGAERAA